jgi:hypothetical protein
MVWGDLHDFYSIAAMAWEEASASVFQQQCLRNNFNYSVFVFLAVLRTDVRLRQLARIALISATGNPVVKLDSISFPAS